MTIGNTLSDVMNNATQHGDTGKLFKTLKKAVGMASSVSETVRELDGTYIRSASRRSDRWKEHFSTLLNRPSPHTPLFDLPFSGFCNVSERVPTQDEVGKAIRSLKSSSAPGEDGISAALWKAGGAAARCRLTAIIANIWSSSSFPSDWKTSVVIPLHKKGDKTDCKNYRGISLIDVAYKVVEAVILDRIRGAVDNSLRENQGGFRPGRGTVDQIFALRQIIEQRQEFRQPLVVAFVDFKAAFDSIDRKRMYEILLFFGMPDKIVQLIEDMYCDSNCVVRIDGKCTSSFPVVTGVKQGALLSPILFNIVLDMILGEAMQGCEGVLVENTRITDLDYADDIALLADNATDMQRMMDRLDMFARQVGLHISAEKTKVMRTASFEPVPILLQGNPLEVVEHFCYLGSVITMDGDSGKELRSRIAKAEGTFSMLSKCLWRSPRIRLRTKLRVYYAAIRPVLMYGCETWPVKVADASRLQSFEFRCWRRILGVSYLERISNQDIIERIHPPSLCTDELRLRRLRYLGHVLRRSESYPARQTLMFNPEAASWTRPRGGVRMTWQRTVLKDLAPLRLSHLYHAWTSDWKKICVDLAADRHQWQMLTRRAVGSAVEPNMAAD